MNLRDKHGIKKNIAKYSISILATLIVGALLVNLQGESPSFAISSIVNGAFGTKTNIGNTIHWFAPCLLSALAALVAFKSGVLNLGTEGQIYFGAFAAAVAGYIVKLPPVIHPIFCMLVGGVFGMLWALIPALLRMIFNISELVSTLILNFVAILGTELFTLMLMKGAKSLSATSIQTPRILETARLTVLVKGTSATTAAIIALALAFIVYLIYRYTLIGYELKQVGENINFAKVGGVNSTKIFLSIFLMSGFIAGVCGAVESIGVNLRFVSTFSPNLGWDGVMIARVAVNHPIGAILVSALWAAFKAGSLQMERVTTLNRYVVFALQALLVLFISINYEQVFQKISNLRRKKVRPPRAMKEDK